MRQRFEHRDGAVSFEQECDQFGSRSDRPVALPRLDFVVETRQRGATDSTVVARSGDRRLEHQRRVAARVGPFGQLDLAVAQDDPGCDAAVVRRDRARSPGSTPRRTARTPCARPRPRRPSARRHHSTRRVRRWRPGPPAASPRRRARSSDAWRPWLGAACRSRRRDLRGPVRSRRARSPSPTTRSGRRAGRRDRS